MRGIWSHESSQLSATSTLTQTNFGCMTVSCQLLRIYNLHSKSTVKLSIKIWVGEVGNSKMISCSLIAETIIVADKVKYILRFNVCYLMVLLLLNVTYCYLSLLPLLVVVCHCLLSFTVNDIYCYQALSKLPIHYLTASWEKNTFPGQLPEQITGGKLTMEICKR